MPDSIDFEKDNVGVLLSDPRVKQLLSIAEKYPMWTIQQIFDNLSKIDGKDLAVDQVKVILNRLNISAQSQRLSRSSWDKIKELVEKEQKGEQKLQPVGVARVTPTSVQTKQLSLVNQYPVPEGLLKNPKIDVSTKEQISLQGGFMRLLLFFSLIKQLRITLVRPYYLFLFFLIAGILIWLSLGGFFKAKPTDISLPVVLDNTTGVGVKTR